MIGRQIGADVEFLFLDGAKSILSKVVPVENWRRARDEYTKAAKALNLTLLYLEPLPCEVS